jgi:hypothetical protein
MKLRIVAAILILLAVLAATPGSMAFKGRMLKPSLISDDETQAQKDKRKEQRNKEINIEQRDQKQNGISIGEPKVYDDALLQQMLSAAQAKLVALQVLDQSKLINALGTVQGADLRTSSLAFNATGPSLPQVMTTDRGATGTFKETDQQTRNKEQVITESDKPSTVSTAKKARVDTLEATSTLPSEDVQTTRPAFNPNLIQAATPPTGLPASSAFSVGSSDLLAEQMQLTYEIANLTLLMEGSLSDRLVVFKDETRMVKPRVTLGFPITLTPDQRHKNAVAVVEVEVEKNAKADLNADDPPAVTALLPREKTYNVASITDSTTSIGGAFVTQIAGFSGSWLRGHKTYYLVKDQDTLALTFASEDKKKVHFLWQFRPVLGQEYVRAGLKQTFVQLAFPSPWSEKEFGTVTVRTYWRKYDRKKGLMKEVLPYSLNDSYPSWPIRKYDLRMQPKKFDLEQLEDLGNGQMHVSLQGRFLSGTSVRIGAARPPLVLELNNIRFVAPIVDLATKPVFLVFRDGSELPLEIGEKDEKPAEIDQVRVTSLDETNSLLTVTLRGSANRPGPPLLLVIGGHAFGYADAPVTRKDNELSVVVPTAFLITHPEVQVKPLFAPRHYARSQAIKVFEMLSQPEHLLVLEQGRDSARFLLYGNRLKGAEITEPANVTLKEFGRSEDSETLRQIELTADQIKAYKQIVLKRENERALLIPIPAVEFNNKPPDPKPRERLALNADEVVIDGIAFEDVVEVTYKGRKVEVVKEGKTSVRLKGLRAVGATSAATTRALDFLFVGKASPIKIEIINNKSEVVQK